MPKKITKSRHAAEDIMAGIRELQGYIDRGMDHQDIKTHYRKHYPDRIRTVSMVAVGEAGKYTAASIKQLRMQLSVSQAVFAASLGVSTVLMQAWEQGTREPSHLARRLLDIVSRDPAAWLASVAPQPASPKTRRAG